MFNKIYVSIKKYMKNNHNFLLFLVLLVIVLNIKLPYIVERPGGITPLKTQIKIDDKYISGNYNSSYVKANSGSVVSVIMGLLIPKWDVVKIDEYTPSDNLDYSDVINYEKILMNQSHNFAIKYVFDKLEIPYNISKEKIYVYSNYEDFKTNLKTSDQIIKCDGNNVSLYEDLSGCINSSSDKNVDLTVIRNKKELTISNPIYFYEGRKVIGVVVIRDFDIISDVKVTFGNNSNESGPSAGFMTALALYDNLSKKNLAKNLKIAGTGTIDEYGNVGEIDGIKYKLLGANNKVDVFFVPVRNYDEALDIVNKYKLNINVVYVMNLDDAISYLETYNKE